LRIILNKPKKVMPMKIKLSELPEGAKGKILELYIPVELRERLFGLGFVEGEQIEVLKRAPLGDPVVYKIKGSSVTLRNDIASKIVVDSSIFPLYYAEPGKYKIVRIFGGRGILMKLQQIGLILEKTIDVEKNSFGKVTILLDGKKHVLPRGQALKILVEEFK